MNVLVHWKDEPQLQMYLIAINDDQKYGKGQKHVYNHFLKP